MRTYPFIRGNMRLFLSCMAIVLTTLSACATQASHKIVTLADADRKIVRSAIFALDACATYHLKKSLDVLEQEMQIDEVEPQIVFVCSGVKDGVQSIQRNQTTIPSKLYESLSQASSIAYYLALQDVNKLDAPARLLQRELGEDLYQRYQKIAAQKYQANQLPAQLCQILEEIEQKRSKQISDRIIKTKLFCNR